MTSEGARTRVPHFRDRIRRRWRTRPGTGSPAPESRLTSGVYRWEVPPRAPRLTGRERSLGALSLSPRGSAPSLTSPSRPPRRRHRRLPRPARCGGHVGPGRAWGGEPEPDVAVSDIGRGPAPPRPRPFLRPRPLPRSRPTFGHAHPEPRPLRPRPRLPSSPALPTATPQSPCGPAPGTSCPAASLPAASCPCAADAPWRLTCVAGRNLCSTGRGWPRPSVSYREGAGPLSVSDRGECGAWLWQDRFGQGL